MTAFDAYMIDVALRYGFVPIVATAAFLGVAAAALWGLVYDAAPLLTDAEREAIEIAIPFLPDGPYTEYDGTPRHDRRATLRALLDRTTQVVQQQQVSGFAKPG